MNSNRHIESVDLTNKGDELYTMLATGQTVWLDKDLADSIKVNVVSQTPKRMFTTVTRNDGLDTWEVMTYRLTPLEVIDPDGSADFRLRLNLNNK